MKWFNILFDVNNGFTNQQDMKKTICKLDGFDDSTSKMVTKMRHTHSTVQYRTHTEFLPRRPPRRQAVLDRWTMLFGSSPQLHKALNPAHKPCWNTGVCSSSVNMLFRSSLHCSDSLALQKQTSVTALMLPDVSLKRRKTRASESWKTREQSENPANSLQHLEMTLQHMPMI